MTKVCTASDILANESYAMTTQGIDVYTLIRRASSRLEEYLPLGDVLVVVGKGKNGADGLALANLLLAKRGVEVYLAYEDICVEGRRYLDEYLSSGGVIATDIDEALSRTDIVVDCVFGTGLSRPVSSDIASIFAKINSSGRYTISADIPSGLHTDTGRVMGACVRANVTVSFSGVKAGYILNDGFDYVGEVEYADIGIECTNYTLSGYEEIDSRISPRARNTHKGDYGRVYVISGSPCYVGASLLATSSATACLRGGAGLVTLCVPYSMREVYQNRVNEETLLFLPDVDGDILCDTSMLDDIIAKADCIVVGMGLGRNKRLKDIVLYLIDRYAGHLVLDADALNCLEGEIAVFAHKVGDIVVTPHIKEFSRLTGIAVGDISPVYDAMRYARDNGVTVALKGASTVVAYPDGRGSIVSNGGAYLSKGGSGDVLAGIVASSLVQGYSVERAVYLHAEAGRRALSEYCEQSLLATDIVNYIGRVDR